ncbi:MAG: helix-turn-helix transcriptional regulator, partial [Hyphomicrobium sp.]|nr:helix-turn-helix transcriptional regulator [Hyphomicrobium sp.]
ERIRQLRTEAGLTLTELGNDLGISHQQLQKYETGTNRLSAGMLAKVAAVLRVSIQTLFDDPEAPPAPIPAKVRHRMEQARAAIDDALQGAA